MKSFERQFADWVSTMPPEEAYNFMSCEVCALAQGLGALGYPVKRAGGRYWRDVGDNRHRINDDLFFALVERPWTFGALSERLAKASPSNAPEEVGGDHG